MLISVWRCGGVAWTQVILLFFDSHGASMLLGGILPIVYLLPEYLRTNNPIYLIFFTLLFSNGLFSLSQHILPSRRSRVARGAGISDSDPAPRDTAHSSSSRSDHSSSSLFPDPEPSSAPGFSRGLAYDNIWANLPSPAFKNDLDSDTSPANSSVPNLARGPGDGGEFKRIGSGFSLAPPRPGLMRRSRSEGNFARVQTTKKRVLHNSMQLGAIGEEMVLPPRITRVKNRDRAPWPWARLPTQLEKFNSEIDLLKTKTKTKKTADPKSRNNKTNQKGTDKPKKVVSKARKSKQE